MKVKEFLDYLRNCLFQKDSSQIIKLNEKGRWRQRHDCKKPTVTCLKQRCMNSTEMTNIQWNYKSVKVFPVLKSLSITPWRRMEERIYSLILLTSSLVGGEWSVSRSVRFTPGERAPCTHWIGGWEGPNAGLDDVEKRKFLTLPGLEFGPLVARSQSPYQLRYPDSPYKSVTHHK
jgi:hypothetical protein